MTSPTLYEQNSSPQRQAATNYLQKYGHLVKWNNCKENILDFGCGDGFVTRNILYPFVEKDIEKITAIDISEQMIEFANTNNKSEKIEFTATDITNAKTVEEMTNKYDHIFSFYCLHWIEEYRSVMESLYKMLRLEGQIFLTCIANSTVHKGFSMLLKKEPWSECLSNSNGFANFTSNPTRHIENMLEEIGFEIELCKVENLCDRINMKDFAKTLGTLYPKLKSIPETLQEKFVEEFANYACEFSTQVPDSKDYELPYDVLILIATKKANL